MKSFNEHLRSSIPPLPPVEGTFEESRKRGITPKGTRSSTGRHVASSMSPPPVPPTREQHRARQSLRVRAVPVTRNIADWLHDTVVVNREEKRSALAVAKKHRCEEVREVVDDGKTRTMRTTGWAHGKTCPRWKPEEKKTEVVTPVGVVDGVNREFTLPEQADAATMAEAHALLAGGAGVPPISRDAFNQLAADGV